MRRLTALHPQHRLAMQSSLPMLGLAALLATGCGPRQVEIRTAADLPKIAFARSARAARASLDKSEEDTLAERCPIGVAARL